MNNDILIYIGIAVLVFLTGNSIWEKITRRKQSSSREDDPSKRIYKLEKEVLGGTEVDYSTRCTDPKSPYKYKKIEYSSLREEHEKLKALLNEVIDYVYKEK